MTEGGDRRVIDAIASHSRFICQERRGLHADAHDGPNGSGDYQFDADAVDKSESILQDTLLGGSPRMYGSDSSTECSEEDKDLLDELKQEDAKVLRDARILEMYNQGWRAAELAREFNVNKSKVFRIVHGTARMDGSTKPGPRTALLPSSEVALAQEVMSLLKRSVVLTSRELSEFAQVVWKAEGHAGKAPRFGKGWRKSFNTRHPGLEFKCHRVAPRMARRQRASTLPNVARAMNGIMEAIGHRAESWQIVGADEIDVSVNDEGLGEKHIGVGKVKPTHCAPNNTPHLTALPFVSYSGALVHTCYIVNSCSVPKFPNKDDQLTEGSIFRSQTGSVDSVSHDGQPSVWRQCAEAFVQALEARRGQFEERRKFVYLVVDGYKVHDDLSTLVYLRSRGVVVVKLSPNLTHLLQLNDHGRINGKIKQRIRTLKGRIAALNNGKMVSIEQWIRSVHDTIRGTVSIDNVVEAAKSLGFVYGPNFRELWMTNESIAQALQRMDEDGRLTEPLEEEDEGPVLRDPHYVNLLSLAKLEGIEHPRQWSEPAIKAVHSYSDRLVYEKLGRFPVSPEPRTILRSSSSSAASTGGTRVLNDDNSLEVRVRAEERKRAEEAEKTSLREERLAKRAAKRKITEDRENRLKQLEQSLPGLDVGQFRSKLGRYLNGSMSLERAQQYVRTKLEPPCATRALEDTAASSGTDADTPQQLFVDFFRL